MWYICVIVSTIVLSYVVSEITNNLSKDGNKKLLENIRKMERQDIMDKRLKDEK